MSRYWWEWRGIVSTHGFELKEGERLMPRTAPRRRHPISRRSTLLLRLVGFRYSRTRDAYVLRVIGNRHGPVFKPVPWQSSPLRQV